MGSLTMRKRRKSQECVEERVLEESRWEDLGDQRREETGRVKRFLKSVRSLVWRGGGQQSKDLPSSQQERKLRRTKSEYRG